MNVSNVNTYYNKICQAAVIQSDESNKKYQVYIPSLHSSLEGIFKTYYKDNNKENSIYKGYFPWASSLVEGLQQGDIVFVSFVNNSTSNILILGKDNQANSNAEGGSDSVNLTSCDNLTDLAMPIILSNEVGLSISAWPNNISNSYFGNINCNDKGAWSIGLIQWHSTRAYDLCYGIASRYTGWKSCFSDSELQLVKAIQSSLNKNQVGAERNSFGEGYTLTEGSSTYNGIYNLITSAVGKTVQKEKASDATFNAISTLQNTYNISNPAIIIFLADIMNQYGTGINNSAKSPNLRGCINTAAKINQDSSKDTIAQLEQFYNWWKSRTSLYLSRRSKVRSYIIELDKQGKLSSSSAIDLGDVASSKYIPELGEYFWPLTKSTKINCYWGERTMAIPYNFKYNTSQKNMGYSSFNRFHYGTDFGPAKVGVDGDPVIAVGSGTVAYVSGNTGGQGNCIALKMDKNSQHYFVYMHLCKKPAFKVGDKVTAGQIIGYMGTTGNSTGTHLHLGLHIGAAWPTSDKTHRIDPLPYLGKKAKA